MGSGCGTHVSKVISMWDFTILFLNMYCTHNIIVLHYVGRIMKMN
jgi:hypothetical protein